MVQPEALLGLRRFFDHPEATFRSPQQGAAVSEVMRGHGDLLVVLPTGGGKSLVFMLPAFLEKGATTVVVVPLVALMSDIRKRAKEKHIDCEVWSHQSDFAIKVPSLILVAIENAVSQKFQLLLEDLFNDGRLKRLVIDECHLVLTWSEFRRPMQKLNLLRPVAVPLVLLTATLPPAMKVKLQVACNIFELEEIRRSTLRKELRYECHTVANGTSESIDEVVFQKTHNFLLRSQDVTDRVIIYCLTRSDVDNLQTRFGNAAESYHAEMDPERKEQATARWTGGSVKLLIATSAFGMGVDFPTVRLIIHRGMSRSLLAYAQEAGRAGRDGRKATVVTVTHPTWRANWIRRNIKSDEEKHAFDAAKEMDDFLKVKRCKRLLLQQYLDGYGFNCLALGQDGELCDV